MISVGGSAVYMLALDVVLAMLGVLVGLAYESNGLTAVAVLSMADMLSLGRPRKEGLGDDYASLVVAIFVLWAGISLVLGGLRELPAPGLVHPLALASTLGILVVKLTLTQLGCARGQGCLRQHHARDACILGLLSVSYSATLLCEVSLEPGLVVIIGVLVLYEAIELISESLQEIRSAYKR